MGWSNGLGLLCKQYFVFITLAALATYAVRFYKTNDKSSFRTMLIIGVSLIPTIALFGLWGGPSPDNQLKSLYLEDGFGFHPSAVSLYLVQLFLYPLPIILYRWRAFYTSRGVLMGSFVLASLYWLFPVRASKPAVAGGVETVGFTHRFLKSLFSEPALIDLSFYILMMLSIPVLFAIGRDLFLRYKMMSFDSTCILHLSVLFFLVIMPFSYLSWEKYFLPLLPGLMILLCLVPYRPTQDLPKT